MKLPGRKFLFRLFLIALLGLVGIYIFARYYLATDTAERQFTELLEREFGLSARWNRVSFSWKFAPRFQYVVLRSPDTSHHWQINARRLDMNYDPGNIWIDIADGQFHLDEAESLNVNIQHARMLLQKQDNKWIFQTLTVTEPDIIIPRDFPLLANTVESGSTAFTLPNKLPSLPDITITDGRVQLTLQDQRLLFDRIQLNIHQEQSPGSSLYYTATLQTHQPGGPIYLLFSLPSDLKTFAWSGTISPGFPLTFLPNTIQTYLPNSPLIRTAGAIERTQPTGKAWIEVAADLTDEATGFVSTHFNFSERTNTIGQIFTDASLTIFPNSGWPVSGSLISQFDIAPATQNGLREFTFDIPSAHIAFVTPELNFQSGPAKAYLSGHFDRDYLIDVNDATLRMNHPQLNWQGRTIESQPLSFDLHDANYKNTQLSAKQFSAKLGDIAAIKAGPVLAGTHTITIAQSSIAVPDIAESLRIAESILDSTFPLDISGNLNATLNNLEWRETLKADAAIQAGSLQIQSDSISCTTGAGQARFSLRPHETTATLDLTLDESHWFGYDITEPVDISLTAQSPQWNISSGTGQWTLGTAWLSGAGQAEWGGPDSQWSLHVERSQFDLDRITELVQEWLEPEEGQLILDSTHTPALSLAARGDRHGIREATGALQWAANSLGYIATDRLAGIENLKVDTTATYIRHASGEDVSIEATFEHPEFFFNDIAIDLGPVSTRLNNQLVRQNGNWRVNVLRLEAPSFMAEAQQIDETDTSRWRVNAECTNAQRFSTLVASSLLAERFPNFSPCTAEGRFEIAGEFQLPFDTWRFLGKSHLDLAEVSLGSVVSMDRLYADLPFDLANHETLLSEPETGEVIIENVTWGVVSIPQAHLTPTLHGESVSWPQELSVRIFNGDVTFGPPTYNQIFTKDWNLNTSIQLQEVNLHQLGVLRESEKDATLSANLSHILLSRGWLKSEGQFTAKVFGGTIVASSVSVSDPMTDYPVWRADIALDNVKLTRLTRYAGFGDIDGKLVGSIESLELDCTQAKIVPIRFDLDIWTREDETGVLSMEALRMITDISEHPALLLPTIGSKGFTFARFGFRSLLNNDRFYVWGRYTENQKPYDLETGEGECYFVLPPRDFLSLFTTRHRLTLTTQNPRKPVSFQHFWKRLTEQLKKSETAPPPPKVAKRFQIPLIDKLLPHGQGKD